IMRATILLVVCFIVRPALFAQDELYTESQLQGMKQRYAEWQNQSPDLSMTVEFDPAPQALDMPHPRFSWIFQLKGRGRKQSAFQILVAGSVQKLQADEGDCWNSGWVTSDQSSLVYYAGKPLQSNTSYYWKVRIRDEAGKTQPFSKVAEFRTALMKQSDWAAGWIGRGATDEIESDVSAFVNHTVSAAVQRIQPDPRSPIFRNEFSISKKVKHASIFIAGLGLYELRLNGAKVGDHVLAVSRTDFRKRILYDSYDVTNQLKSGQNAIGIVLGNGWFNGQKKYWGWQMQWYGSPRVIMQLEIEYEDGSKERIATNRHWKAAWSPITFNCLFDGE
ncbi:MAG TPA: alpha-L-rhamnosidase N-terminal domain-containing protein, partial [Chitinophagaceae bacterium]|nr:alpha-L-rhamnosidase N-terminal domain-containing protein [Chitinophagaceae bacterium]